MGKMTMDGRGESDENDHFTGMTCPLITVTMTDAATIARALGGKRNGEEYLERELTEIRWHDKLPDHLFEMP